ncbi:heterokaryon incompatibility protein-domain-containing protein [Exophiala viscosa]|uniref:heterokaryon incompatibility protein-domain-containing protein n=1 Tax=Exophiala viscosa TaxID=2486360 RepID=UPI00219BA0B5|nr:heterokaryon incompatibility protein-domain-containing protein [Exophiala viscosa]
MAALQSLDHYEPYHYTRLRQPDNIRLVRLLPSADGTDELRVDVLEQSLSTVDGTYTAISYAWGDTSIDIQRPIFCNGRIIRIYPTLHSALLKLRHQSEVTLVWCDGLCIDQGADPESLEERSIQVQIMSEIYTNAQRVVADLGDDLGHKNDEFIFSLYELAGISTKHLEAVFPAFEYHDFFIDEDEEDADEDADDADDEYSGDDYEEGQSASQDPEQSSPPRHASNAPSDEGRSVDLLIGLLPACVRQKWLWHSLGTLVARPYFGRLWVIQEHALGREVVFMIGRTQIRGSILARAMLRLYNTSFYCLGYSNEVTRAQHRVPYMASLNPVIIFRIREYIMGRTFDRSKITLDRLIYGLLGLCHADERNHPSLRVDYRESVESLSLRMSRLFLSNGAHFVLYHSVGCCSEASTPSWVIDLCAEKRDDVGSLVLADGTCDDALYNAGHAPDQANPRAFQPLVSRDSHLLTVTAILLPAICSLSTTCPYMDKKTPSSKNVHDWVSDLLTWASDQDMPTSIDIRKALLSTVSADTLSFSGHFYRASLDAVLPGSEILTAALYCIEYTGPDILTDDYSRRMHRSAFSLMGCLMFAQGCAVGFPLRSQELVSLLYLVPGCAKPGDVVAIFVGLPVPFVLRPTEPEPGLEGPVFRIVGSAYAHGMMDGQIFSTSLPEQLIHLR